MTGIVDFAKLVRAASTSVDGAVESLAARNASQTLTHLTEAAGFLETTPTMSQQAFGVAGSQVATLMGEFKLAVTDARTAVEQLVGRKGKVRFMARGEATEQLQSLTEFAERLQSAKVVLVDVALDESLLKAITQIEPLQLRASVANGRFKFAHRSTGYAGNNSSASVRRTLDGPAADLAAIRDDVREAQGQFDNIKSESPELLKRLYRESYDQLDAAWQRTGDLELPTRARLDAQRMHALAESKLESMSKQSKTLSEFEMTLEIDRPGAMATHQQQTADLAEALRGSRQADEHLSAIEAKLDAAATEPSDELLGQWSTAGSNSSAAAKTLREQLENHIDVAGAMTPQTYDSWMSVAKPPKQGRSNVDYLDPWQKNAYLWRQADYGPEAADAMVGHLELADGTSTRFVPLFRQGAFHKWTETLFYSHYYARNWHGSPSIYSQHAAAYAPVMVADAVTGVLRPLEASELDGLLRDHPAARGVFHERPKPIDTGWIDHPTTDVVGFPDKMDIVVRNKRGRKRGRFEKAS
uniref:Uncharacterized protein n=1 Tax=uncultured bacterium W5-102b TaxID=1130996 RepID=H9BWK3_9BACT|nr:hypothetical protein [uncultured bacterium W5-102b]